MTTSSLSYQATFQDTRDGNNLTFQSHGSFGDYDVAFAPSEDLDDLIASQVSFSPQAVATSRYLLAPTNLLVALICAICDSLAVAVVLLFNTSKVRTTMNILLANLALSDLLAATLSSPFFIHSYWTGEWAFGSAVCAGAGFLKKTSLFVSTNCLVCISIHRAVVAIRSFKPRTSMNSARTSDSERHSKLRCCCSSPCHRPHLLKISSLPVLLSLIWVLSALGGLPTLLYSKADPYVAGKEIHRVYGHTNSTSTEPHGTTHHCLESGWPVDGHFTLKTYISIVIIAEFLAPVIIIITCHALICNQLRMDSRRNEQAARMIELERIGQQQTEVLIGHPESANHESSPPLHDRFRPPWLNPRDRRRKLRAFYLLTAIALAFIACWAPWYVFEAYRTWSTSWNETELRQHVMIWPILETLATANSAANALLNVLANKNIRKYAATLVKSSAIYRGISKWWKQRYGSEGGNEGEVEGSVRRPVGEGPEGAALLSSCGRKVSTTISTGLGSDMRDRCNTDVIRV